MTTELGRKAPPARRPAAGLQPEIAQGGVVVGTTPEGPVVFALAVADRHIIDAREAQPHEAMCVELPIFIAVTAKPVAAVVMTLVGKTHRNAIVVKRPEFLRQAVV